MEKMSRSISRQEKTSLEDLHWFFAKSKVPICLAVTECDPFLDRFLEAAVLSEEESLVLKADTRSVHRVIYESLCWIEAKNFPLEYIFDNLFQKPFLKLYPKLKPICDEYKQGKYKNGVQSSLDKEQDQVIFAQDKVKICWAITDLFPFIHGLQDLTILSETESLKLQADGRSVSRVIYESLSLIEKKDLHLGVVFEYIFQPCYQTLYPGLQAILQESSADLAGPFNGKQYVEFNNPDSLVEFFELNKSGIAEAINECFPFLNGLHDMGLLAKMELLKLLADKRPPDKVLYEALNWIQQKSYMEVFFTYLFREFYLNRFPDLRIILYKLNKVIALDMCCSVPGSLQDLSPSTQSDSLVLSHRETAVTVPPRRSASPSQNTDPPMRPPCDSLRTHSKLRVSVVRLRSNGEDFSPLMPENKKSPRTPRNQSNNRELESLDEDVKDLVVQQTRKCRLKPICYTELSDNDWEFIGDMKTHAGAKSSLHRRRKQEQHKGTDHQIPIDGLWDITIEQKWIKDAANVAVNLEFPKQIFNDVFNVRCGPKKGIFMKEHWTGDPSNDMCIKCDKKMFTVIMFEKYGGKENHKNWKRSIHCAGIKLEKLFHSGILKMPRKWQKSF